MTINLIWKSTNMNVDIALEIATKAHNGQKRWNGEDYLEHPKRVMRALIESGLGSDEVCSVALLHDVVEDSHFTLENLQDAGFSPMVVEAVNLLTKKPSQSYDEYLYGVSLNYYAVLVKQADLMDNLSDLKPGQRRDKYLASLLYLKTTVRFMEILSNQKRFNAT